jgi:hypothetical protein
MPEATFGARFHNVFNFSNVAAGGSQESQLIIDGYDFLVEDPIAIVELFGALGNLVAGTAIADEPNYTAANQAPTRSQFRTEISVNGLRTQSNPVKLNALFGSPKMPKVNHRPYVLGKRQTVTVKLYNDSAVAVNAQVVLGGTRLDYAG